MMADDPQIAPVVLPVAVDETDARREALARARGAAVGLAFPFRGHATLKSADARDLTGSRTRSILTARGLEAVQRGPLSAPTGVGAE